MSSPSLGPHCFIVPIRDESGNLYPGVPMIDMMHKGGEAPADPSCPHGDFLLLPAPPTGSHPALLKSEGGMTLTLRPH